MKDPAAGATREGVKTFVLDTNVLLHDPDALLAFKEHTVVVPFTVLEELDTFKTGNNDLNRSARMCIRTLDKLRSHGSLMDGVDLSTLGDPERGGVLQIAISPEKRPHAIQLDTPDNRIIAVATEMQDAGLDPIFVSKDINARVKAESLGIRAEDYEHKKVNTDRLYHGYMEVDATGDVIDELYSERMLAVDRLELDSHTAENNEGAYELGCNEFVILNDPVDPSHSGVGRRIADTDHVVPVTSPRKPIFGVMARSMQQTMAMDVLLDDEIKLVTLTGGAGTGKTLLALAVGMHKVFQEQRYERLLVARPIIPMGRDIGFLPGDKDEKLSAWMQPIFDNLDYLLSSRGSHLQQADSKTVEQRIEKLLADGKLLLEPLTYIRGRSIPHQFMIVDEAQNLSPHEIKTIVSRVGEGTKLVLTGDIEQIDHPYLDASSNGLSTVIERLRNEPLVAHVTLEKSERSELASLAAHVL